MKVVYEDNEKEVIDNGSFLDSITNPSGKYLNDARLVRSGGEYNIKFRVTDEAKANMFIYDIVFGRWKPDVIKSVEDVCGIKFNSLDYDTSNKLEIIKDLKRIIEKYENEI